MLNLLNEVLHGFPVDFEADLKTHEVRLSSHWSQMLGESTSLTSTTMQELMRYTGKTAGTPRPIIAVPDWFGQLQAAAMSILPENHPGTVQGMPAVYRDYALYQEYFLS